MGKRSAGKFVNPTDRARKEARKKELKKNKKQRLAVREAVIKSKDPYQILADLERLDQLQYNVGQQPAMNEKVLQDKRRKLKETWDRVMRMYHKEEKEKWIQFKRMEDEYERKRIEMQRHYEAVKSAQNVSLEEIPLPPCMIETSAPGPRRVAPSLVTHRITVSRQPPGPPPGLPPDLSELDDAVEEKAEQKNEEDVDEFLREIEQVVPRQIPVPMPSLIPPIIPLPTPAMGNAVKALATSAVPPRIPPHPAIQPRGPRPNLPSDQQRPGDDLRKTSTKAPSEAVTIEAKPQLRNLSADSTRFMPTSLRIKRHEQKPVKRATTSHGKFIFISFFFSFTFFLICLTDCDFFSFAVSHVNTEKAASSDDAYQEFMKEMQGLL